MTQLLTRQRTDTPSIVPGILTAALATAAATGLHGLVSGVGTLTWAILLGVVAANTGLLPRSSAPGIAFAVRRLLRIGIVLLGFSLSLTTVAALGGRVLAVILLTVLSTLAIGLWLGSRMGVPTSRRLVIAVGCAICGASAIAAVEGAADADEDDVAVAVAVVTIFGSIAMLVLPLLQVPLGLDDRQLGIWAGASVHEVGQVIGAATPAGATAVAVATVVKLCRVLCLAPVTAAVGLARGRTANATTRPPLVPLFVIGFFGCAVLRTVGIVPSEVVQLAALLQGWLLAAALFGLGTGVRIRSLVRTSGPALALGAATSLTVSVVALAGVKLLA
ncbi:MAG: putative sulfate exporter family transporter [Marmoricola sp.]|jgi:uncharacterized integral membrane protein (TIGR00698 family)|nr:putative sulfate exporter family transporter [Marmoricola sp.]